MFGRSGSDSKEYRAEEEEIIANAARDLFLRESTILAREHRLQSIYHRTRPHFIAADPAPLTLLRSPSYRFARWWAIRLGSWRATRVGSVPGGSHFVRSTRREKK